MKKLIIFGTGDIAQIANYYFKIDSDYEVVAFTVDTNYIQETIFEGLPVVAFEEIEQTYSTKEHDLFVALSYSKMNKIRADKYQAAKNKGYKLASYISSHCTYVSQFPPGDNCFIFEDNTIQPFVKIGNNVTLWSGNHIGHHSTIEDHNFISSHVVISGHCTIKSYCFLGVNATLRNGITIAPETIVGMGATIMRNTQDKAVHVPPKSEVISKKSDEVKL